MTSTNTSFADLIGRPARALETPCKMCRGNIWIYLNPHLGYICSACADGCLTLVQPDVSEDTTPIIRAAILVDHAVELYCLLETAEVKQ